MWFSKLPILGATVVRLAEFYHTCALKYMLRLNLHMSDDWQKNAVTQGAQILNVRSPPCARFIRDARAAEITLETSNSNKNPSPLVWIGALPRHVGRTKRPLWRFESVLRSHARACTKDNAKVYTHESCPLCHRGHCVKHKSARGLSLHESLSALNQRSTSHRSYLTGAGFCKWCLGRTVVVVVRTLEVWKKPARFVFGQVRFSSDRFWGTAVFGCLALWLVGLTAVSSGGLRTGQDGRCFGFEFVLKNCNFAIQVRAHKGNKQVEGGKQIKKTRKIVQYKCLDVCLFFAWVK